MDTKNLIAYSKVYEYLLGEFPSDDTYEDRILAQKIGYLAQDCGIYLGEMNYFWHKRGPYSRSLASALRYFQQNRECFIQECSNVKIYYNILPKLDLIKSIIEARTKDCPEIIWLEICASLKYLSKESPSDNIDMLSSLLIKKKPFLDFHFDDIHKSWNIMNSLVTV
ncbi:hypothetical protein [Paenibacillus odorifer]|uniref:Uncharacterized protein n=1 Tax=Paenibacillus odorifer TaxID=189426 RepID=A0AAD0KL20_9BACL|nr:hypothetical protein [Paenibacillus odorifer]AWV35141.1 hypothetical protein CD191_22275 [Paenibacillus odorifer]